MAVTLWNIKVKDVLNWSEFDESPG